MDYNIVTGELSFTPRSDQIGDIALTFSAQSGDQRVTQTMTVPAPNPADPTVFTGRVVDASNFTEGLLVPVVGATVTFLGSGVSTSTDVDGFFTLSGLPVTATLFDIDASTAQRAPGGAA